MQPQNKLIKKIFTEVMRNVPARSPPHPTPSEPDLLHELIVEAIKMPEFMAPIIEASGQEFEESKLGDTTLRAPTSVFADAVRVFYRGGRPSLAVVLEVQLDVDDDKFRAWRRYICRLGEREECPVLLFVICVDPRTETWAQETLDRLPFKNPGLVISPNQLLEAVPGCDEALAVLSAAAYKKAKGALAPEPYLANLLSAAWTDKWGPLCYDVLAETFSPEIIKEYMMTRELKPTPKRLAVARALLVQELNAKEAEIKAADEAAAEARAEAALAAETAAQAAAQGAAQGRIWTAIELRQLDCTEQQRRRIEAETDTAVLKTWAARATTAPTVDAMLGLN